MKSLFYQCFLVFFMVAGIVTHSTAAGAVKPSTVGYVEKIRIQDTDTVIAAKLDTGAQTSSINAVIIDEVGESIIFEIATGKKKEETIMLKKKIERYVHIKKKNHKGIIPRPVVKMTFCIAGRLIEGDVNLANRAGFNYQVLIGRNMLTKGKLIVDAASQYTSKPNCIQQNDEDKPE